MLIRRERPTDSEAIDALVQEAFSRAEHSDGNEQELVNALRQGAAYIPELSLICEINDTIVGHILFTKAFVNDCCVVVLAPLSVAPAFQKRGIGTLLIREGHRIAQTLGYAYSMVLGEPQYYGRLGYIPADNYRIQAPFEVSRELFMALRLDEQSPELNGILEYAPEFGIV